MVKNTDPFPRAFDFTPDGKLLAVIEQSGEISLWEPSSGKMLRRLYLPEKTFRGSDLNGSILRFSPNGVAMIITIEDYLICRIELTSGKVCWQKRLQTSNLDLAFSPDGKLLALAQMGIIELWDTTSGKSIRRFKKEANDQYVRSIAFSPNGTIVAAGRVDSITLFEVSTGKELGRFHDGKMGDVFSLAFLAKGQRLISCSKDLRVRVWDIKSHKTLLVLKESLKERWIRILSMALSPDSKTVALGAADGTVIHLWDLVSVAKLFSGTQGHSGLIGTIRMSLEGGLLISNGADESIRCWDLKNGSQVCRLLCGYGAFSFSSDGRRLAIVPRTFSEDEDGEDPVLWNVLHGTPITSLKLKERERFHSVAIRSAEFVANKKFLVTSGKVDTDSNPKKEMGLLIVWDAQTGRRVREFVLPDTVPSGMVQHPDDNRAIIGTEDGPIIVFSLDRGTILYALNESKLEMDEFFFSPSGRILLSLGSDNHLYCWELFSGRKIFQSHVIGGRFLALSPDGRLVAFDEQKSRLVIDDAHAPPVIHLWDMEAKKEAGQLRGHESAVSGVLFTPDGNKLVTGLRNGSILVWDVTPFTRRIRESKRLTNAELQACWNDLAATDSSKAYRSILQLGRVQ